MRTANFQIVSINFDVYIFDCLKLIHSLFEIKRILHIQNFIKVV